LWPYVELGHLEARQVKNIAHQEVLVSDILVYIPPDFVDQQYYRIDIADFSPATRTPYPWDTARLSW